MVLNNLDNECFERVLYNYKNLSEIFRLPSKDYAKQFSNIYCIRTTEMRKMLEDKALEKWGVPAERLMTLNNVNTNQRAVIGTIYKRQELKPSILKEVSKQYQTVPPPPRNHFVSDTDELILEDETQRITLHGVLDVNTLVTGVVIAVYGILQPNGIFLVEDYCFPALLPIPNPFVLNDDKYLVMISGIELATCKSLFPLQLFTDWLIGWLGTNEDHKLQSKITRLIIAGGCVRSKAQTKEKYSKVVDNSVDVDAVKELDELLEQLAQNIDVNVMPGEYDPTNHTLPQQPLHKCLFPKASRYVTFQSVTNPYIFEIEGCLVAGTSGQPVDDIQRYSVLDDPIDVLEKTLDWSHLVPTAPDTLACYPYGDKDPFILKNRPHVYFAGNQPEFKTKLKKYDSSYSTRLVCIPSFVKTQSCVLVNLRTLECEIISFNICTSED